MSTHVHMIPSMISCSQHGIAVKLEDVCSICLTFTTLVLARSAQFLHVKYLKAFYTSHSLQYSTFRLLKFPSTRTYRACSVARPLNMYWQLC